MKIEDAIAALTDMAARQPNREQTLVVTVLSPGKIGSSPCVTVTDMHAGFDWNSGKILLSTDKQLTVLSPEDVAAIHKSAKDGQSWHAFKRYERQANEIQVLKNEIATLKGVTIDSKTKAL